MTNPYAALSAIVAKMRDFETQRPSPQQTRAKSAREMVGHFAYELEQALDALPAAARPSEGAQQEPRDWLIYDERSECYWGPDRGGYWKSIAHAGLYTEKEAREAEDFAKRYQRQEVAVPLSKFGVEIKRLADALAERAAIDTLLGAVPSPTEPSEGALDTQDYRNAPSGVGPLAAEWKNKNENRFTATRADAADNTSTACVSFPAYGHRTPADSCRRASGCRETTRA